MTTAKASKALFIYVGLLMSAYLVVFMMCITLMMI